MKKNVRFANKRTYKLKATKVILLGLLIYLGIYIINRIIK